MPKPFIFVLMPFADTFEDVYKLGIKPACEEAGAYCERVDEQIFSGSILERVYNQIAKADLIIADLTGRNPNVFYETGYAHALGKRVILLTQDANDIPFDLKHYSHIIYAGKIVTLKSELQPRVRWFLENPEGLTVPNLDQLSYYISGSVLEPFCRIEIYLRRSLRHSDSIEFALDIHNSGERIFDSFSDQLGLVVMSYSYFRCANHPTVSLPDGNCLIDLGPIGRILPGGWKSIKIDFDYHSFRGGEYNCELRIFTEISSRTVSFSALFLVP